MKEALVMAMNKRHTADQTVNKLRHADVVLSKDAIIAQAC
jgi:hypothetical protein